MSVGPQLQLAVLWPWLLMATLQIRLGYSGLALAAAVEADRSLAQKAIIRVVPFKLEPLMLEGVFASVADVTPAEGKLLQSMLDGDLMLISVNHECHNNMVPDG
ncbi:UNVERIFIED_CONTAM: E3 ubiquitin-protein ligase rnf43 [Gekko kuhli]